jgi:hypothetical protein
MNQKGTFILEYLCLIVVVGVAILLMAIYVNRSLQGKLHEATEGMAARYEYGGKVKSELAATINRHITTKIFEPDPNKDILRTEVVIDKDESNRSIDESIQR